MKFVKKVLIRTTLATNLVLINLAKMNQNFFKKICQISLKHLALKREKFKKSSSFKKLS